MPDQSAVNLSNCDREPIHIPGSIQPHGCLIACDYSLTSILRCSSNVALLLGQDAAATTPSALIGQPLSVLMDESLLHDLRNAAAAARDGAKPRLLLGVRLRDGGPVFDVSVHQFKGASIIEFEPADSDGRDAPLEIARTLISVSFRCPDVAAMVARLPKLLRAVLGYDRVMIYQFLRDGSGEVIGEAKRHDLEPFLGLHFPASDIPQQARALYLRNTIRIISDASGARVPIEPVLDPSGEPLDLSFAHLRSVSPIHCEYLRNMGVGASMSISIIVDGVLWGLIACHHYTPRILSMARRVAAEMFGDFFSLQLQALEQKAKLQLVADVRQALDRILRGYTFHGDVMATLTQSLEETTSLIPSDGAGLWVGGVWTSLGVTPPGDAIPALAHFLVSTAGDKVWATHELPAALPGATAYAAKVSGLLAVPLSQIPRDYLVFFRREVLQAVKWAGDPNKQYETGPFGDRLTPRKSFAIWRETVENQSPPWSDDERKMAEAIRSTLLEVIMRHHEILESERQTAAVRQKLINEELNHRVKNILALIMSLVSQPLDNGRDIVEYVASVKGRIKALAHAHDQIVRSDGGGSLHRLLEAEVSPYKGAVAELELDGPTLVLNARAYSVMALVIHELATNAAKYGALSVVSGRLKVTWSRTPEGALELAWRESGGPPVSQPKRTGFGTILLNRSVPFDLNGEAHVAYDPDGVFARFVIPAQFITEASGAQESAADQIEAPAATALDGLRVLLLEDQLIIAMDVEAMLAELGASGLETAASVDEALEKLQSGSPDLCVFDVNIAGVASFPVAEEALRRGIPFVFATGYSEAAEFPLSMANIPVVRKPYDKDKLAVAVAAALSGIDRT